MVVEEGRWKMPRRAKRIDPLKMNKEIAYKGDIGKRREDFCVDFIKKKGEIIKEIQADQAQAVAQKGETITCRKGCSHCCYLYMQASVPECEAIVYYLYHNGIALATFLKNYRDWRKKLRQNGDIFQKCARLWYDKTAQGAGLKEYQAFEEEATRYQQQNAPCPFLHNNSCLIYEVRPFLCAGTVATTPNEYCSPSSANKPAMYRTQTPAIFDKSFYYREIDGFVLTFFPITVYDILEGGYRMLAKITGLEDLEEAVLREPEVRAVMERFS